MGENIKAYFLEVTGARSVRSIADACGIGQTTLNRQLTGSTSLTVETVVAICRAYGLDMADVFVRVGFITDAEARRLGTRLGLSAFTDLELAKEIVDRIASGQATEVLTGELPTTDVPGPGATKEPEQNVATSVEDASVLTREEEQALRKSEHALAAFRGRNDADVPHAE